MRSAPRGQRSRKAPVALRIKSVELNRSPLWGLYRDAAGLSWRSGSLGIWGLPRGRTSLAREAIRGHSYILFRSDPFCSLESTGPRRPPGPLQRLVIRRNLADGS
jgi:hypothetical protein